ncbi:bromodomain-containing protein DDB_G0270170-like isoform X3 [Solenopsis invicta]|nr:bromodomain-containing protein DDB_G0270170-like isoform X3 [Solenopsis invicta]
MSNYNYAVVQFPADQTYSEIPITWLKEDDSQCWWPPRTSNCLQMIANCESPDYKTWATYKINVVKLCTSLGSARKHAADSQYQTTDEDRLGRGQRPHVPYNRFSSDAEECSTNKPRKYVKKKQVDIVTSRPPSCPENFGLSEKGANREYRQVTTSQQAKRLKTNNTGVAKPLSHPESSKSFNKGSNHERNKMSQGDTNANTNTIVCRNKSPLLFDDREPSDVEYNDEYNSDDYNNDEYNNDESNNDEHNNDEYNSDDYNNDESTNEEHNNDEIPTSQEQDNQSSGFKETWQDVPVINFVSPLRAQQALQQKNDDISHIKRCLQRLLQMQAASNLTLKDIKQRQIKLENVIKSITPIGLKPLDSDDSLIVELLPLVTINNMKEFDSLLKTSNEVVTQFKQFLLKIGGNNPRDNIHRILKKIFTNECAVNCSWKGVRKNFRLDNLHFIKMIRRM